MRVEVWWKDGSWCVSVDSVIVDDGLTREQALRRGVALADGAPSVELLIHKHPEGR